MFDLSVRKFVPVSVFRNGPTQRTRSALLHLIRLFQETDFGARFDPRWNVRHTKTALAMDGAVIAAGQREARVGKRERQKVIETTGSISLSPVFA